MVLSFFFLAVLHRAITYLDMLSNKAMMNYYRGKDVAGKKSGVTARTASKRKQDSTNEFAGDHGLERAGPSRGRRERWSCSKISRRF